MAWSGAEPVLVSHGCPTNRNFSAFMQVEGFLRRFLSSPRLPRCSRRTAGFFVAVAGFSRNTRIAGISPRMLF